MRWVGDRGACRQERRRFIEPSGAHCCTWRERSAAIDCCAAGLGKVTEVAVAGLFVSAPMGIDAQPHPSDSYCVGDARLLVTPAARSENAVVQLVRREVTTARTRLQ